MDTPVDIANDIIKSHDRHFEGDIENRLPLWSEEQKMCLFYANGKIASCELHKNWWENTADEQSELIRPLYNFNMKLPFRHFSSNLTFAVLTYEECMAYRARLEKIIKVHVEPF